MDKKQILQTNKVLKKIFEECDDDNNLYTKHNIDAQVVYVYNKLLME